METFSKIMLYAYAGIIMGGTLIAVIAASIGSTVGTKKKD